MKTIMALITIGLLSLSALASDSYGTPFEGNGFVKDDWQVVCDNTLTCRAAGYSADSVKWRGSILMTLQAGEKVPSTEILLNEWDWNTSERLVTETEALNNPVELWLNDKFYGEVKNSQLTKSQTMLLINHAKKASKIAFKIGTHQWQVSDLGMAAVLLKLDEVQGRVGTPLALVSKNSLNRQTNKAAKPKPVLKKAPVYLEEEHKQLDSSKLAYFQKNIDKWVNINSKKLIGSKDVMGDCELVNPKTDAYQQRSEYESDMVGWDFIPVDDSHTLAAYGCWTGAYNEGYGYWLIDHKYPNHPQLITTAGSDYYEGKITAAHKSRGLGDCWSMKEWVWNGEIFNKTLEQTTGLCRLIEAGGAWDLPTYVSDVISQSNK